MASSTKAPYDPVKALEGMFNGSVTRIAYAIKDPINFSAPTKTILTECAKRYHDALDDCEIQLLDAKWYLEHQLKLNKARREAKAREMGTAAKRKHDAIQEVEGPQKSDETPTKRAKVDEEKTKSISPESNSASAPVATTPAPAIPAAQPTPKQTTEQPKDQPQPTAPQPNKPPEPMQDEAQPIQDDFAKPTPQATPAGTNDDFNFESMFNDAAGDSQDNKDEDLNFDFGIGDTFDTGMGDINNDPSSLDSLLPGLDSFANQPADNLNAVNANFDLPEIGGTNVFDEFLNDDSLGRGNYENDVEFSEEAWGF